MVRQLDEISKKLSNFIRSAIKPVPVINPAEEGNESMFRVIPNPHKNGKMTRTMLFEAGPGQTFAVDAEHLHSSPRLLDGVRTRASWIIRGFDLVAYLILAASLVMSVLVAWWLWIPGSVICAAMLYIVQRSAGSFAREAAMKSNDAFLYLHSVGALWVVHSASTA